MMARYMQQGLKIHLYVLLGMIFSAVVVHAEAEQGEKSMSIAEGSTVSVEYTLTLQDKEVIDTNKGGQPLTFVYGAKQIIPGLEREMAGMKIGESRNVTVLPGEGYGPVLEQAIIEVGKDKLPAEAWQVGAHVQGQGPGGQVVQGQVMALQENKATIDFNHPLAGKTLYFEVKVLDIQ
jgi:FKBP-type peptidyl-prolyl cis-trans isomerase SlyD